MSDAVETFMAQLKAKNPAQPEFHQAVREVLESVMPVVLENPVYQKAKILERVVEPERVVMFRVPWVDDRGEVQVNRGYRVQMNSALGPYKGGLRFHASVTLGTMKFLAFEQIFKNSLTTLPMGGGKGGSDFQPRGKSENEVMRFCQSFMTELFRHVGADTDVPAGDVGVGGREIGYMFGQYKRLVNRFEGVLTGKGRNWGGSLIRPEATGYGAAYFLQRMLARKGESMAGKTITISGYGNVGSFFIEKANEYGAKVVTIGDEAGYAHDPEGISGEKLEFLKDLWAVYRQPAKAYSEKYGVPWVDGKRPWEVPCDIAVPTAIENELDEADAQTLVRNGCVAVVEGANMPSTAQAIDVFRHNGVLFGPCKAANAGGVATSGLEMSQNSMRLSWTREEVDAKLQHIMHNIHDVCVQYGADGAGNVDYVRGANIAGFRRVADAMLDQGVV
jgi:glutamate dehydrogenase (NADP+)